MRDTELMAKRELGGVVGGELRFAPDRRMLPDPTLRTLSQGIPSGCGIRPNRQILTESWYLFSLLRSTKHGLVSGPRKLFGASRLEFTIETRLAFQVGTSLKFGTVSTYDPQLSNIWPVSPP